MSRSRHDKSGKGPGYEYGAPRPGNGGCTSGPGKYGGKRVKTFTHRIERRRGKMLSGEDVDA
jgi:hypothetical protein